MRLRVISSDLTRANTKVFNADTGEMLQGVQSIKIDIDADSRPVVTLVMNTIDLDIIIPEEFVEI
jgi:hypothetical protein